MNQIRQTIGAVAVLLLVSAIGSSLAHGEVPGSARQNSRGEQHYARGVALLKKQQFALAIQELRQSVRLNPSHAEAHNALGEALGRSGRLDAAVVELNEAIRLKPDFGEAYNNLGIALRQRGDFDGAIAAFRRAAELGPQDAEVLTKWQRSPLPSGRG